MRGAEPDKIELRPDRDYSDESPGHVVHPNGSLVGSGHRGFLGAAGRAVLAMLHPDRVCVCPPAERIVEPDGSCFRCLARVVHRAPFHVEDWT